MLLSCHMSTVSGELKPEKERPGLERAKSDSAESDSGPDFSHPLCFTCDISIKDREH